MISRGDVATREYPPHICIDPKRGAKGGRFVLVTCQMCGKEVRMSEGKVVGRIRHGRTPQKFCSYECYGRYRRLNR